MTSETYLVGGTLYPVTPEVPTAVCDTCGQRRKARRDGTPVMHTRQPRPGELAGVHWCQGGVPEHVRWTTRP